MSPSPDIPRAPDKLKVLVVDDEPTLRLGFSYALANRTTEVATAPDGRIALEKLADGSFDLVILDLRMPEIDGIGVVESMRNRGDHTPVVLCSAALTSRAALRAIRLGIVDFLLKPVRPADLRQIIPHVTNPGKGTLPLALKAARDGDPATAIGILESADVKCTRARYWLGIFKSIRDADQAQNPEMLEEAIRGSLPILAFNALLNP